MPLCGRIPNYGLADVLQLLSQGSRSGHLRLNTNASTTEIFIATGMVVKVHSSSTSHDGTLGVRLLQADLITSTILNDLLELRAQTGASLSELLLSHNHLNEETIRQHTTVIHWNILMSPFTWSSGTYEFQESEPHLPDPWAHPINVNHMLLKGLRLVEEWPWARRHIPSMEWIIGRRVPLPHPSHDVDPFGVPEEVSEPQPAPEVSEEARVVHTLAAPGKGLINIVSSSPYDRYATTLALAELSAKRYVVVTPP
ncbi:MAG: DUF4388 domain-containing protein [Myxococcales bacterium]|nr:DUF4388 domain-containing protein [Myxococcales bacterium]